MSATDPDGQGEPTGDSDPPGEEAATDGHRDRRSTFATWRRSRPFWGGVFAVLGGVELILIPLAPMPVVIHQGIAGISSYLIGALLAVIGLLLWFQPNQRTFYGIVAVLLSLASFVTSNFGGFVVGELLGLVGGALGFAWMPGGSTPRRGRDRSKGTRALGIALLPALLAGSPALAGGQQAHADTHGTRACLIPVFCPDDDDSPSPTPTSSPHTSDDATPAPRPSGTSGPHRSAEPTTGPSAGPSTGPSGGLSGEPRPSTSHSTSGGHSATPKPTGPAAKFSPKPTHLPAKKATTGGAKVTVESNALTADSMTQYGLSFDGVVAMPTTKGTVRMLKFSADRVVLKNMALTVTTSGGTRTTTKSPDVEFTGNVELYTTKLHAKLVGIPLTFTPNFPPPLVLPTMRMTDVTTTRNYTKADAASISGLGVAVR